MPLKGGFAHLPASVIVSNNFKAVSVIKPLAARDLARFGDAAMITIIGLS